MKTYKVTVNGTAYEITLEAVDAAEIKTPAAPVAAAPAAPAPVAAPAPAAAPAGGETVTSPMPGTILDVKVAQGQAVKKGDVLLILEAMKMENEITAECDGVVKQILVGSSTVVNTDDVLAVI